MYTMAESLRGQLKRGLDTTVLYIGKQARSSSFTFTFDGVPPAIMSTSQLEYFLEFTKSFTSNSISESIYEVVVQSQEIVAGTLVVTGQFLGVDAGGEVAPQAFTDNISSTLRNKNAEYIQGLAYNVLRPTSTLDKIDAGYFQDITDFQLDMEAIVQSVAPTPAPVNVEATAPTAAGGSGGNAVTDLTKAASDADSSTLIIVAVIGVICLCIAVLVLYICCKWSRKDVLDFDKNQTSTYPALDDDYDDDSDDDNNEDAVVRKKKISSDRSLELSVDNKPPLTRTASSRQPSSSSLGKGTPPPIKGMQRGQSMSVINQKSEPPKLGQSKSGDELPRPNRNADFKKSHSSDGLSSSNSRLPSLIEEKERPRRRPKSASFDETPVGNSRSEESTQRPPVVRSLPQRSKSGDVIPRQTQIVPPSPIASEDKQVTASRAPPKRENSMGATRQPPPSNAGSGLDRNNSGNVPAATPFSPKARVPPTRAQSMKPNVAARNTAMIPKGTPPSRSKSSESTHPIQPQPQSKINDANRRPSPPVRTPSTNGQPTSTSVKAPAGSLNTTPQQQQQQQQRPMPSPRNPSPRRPETGSNGNGPNMTTPATPNRNQEMRTVPRTPSNSTPKRQMPPHQLQQQQHQQRPSSPQRTISLPAKNVPPNRPATALPIKEKMDSRDRSKSSNDVLISSPTRTKSMPIKPIQNASNGNQASLPKSLSPIT
jgi:hypothetical protein